MEVSIEDLPEEILVNIFEKLGLPDILICSRVNKKWKNVVELEWFGSKYGGSNFVKFLINFNEPSRSLETPNFSLTNCEIQQLKNLNFTTVKIIDNVVRAIFELAISKVSIFKNLKSVISNECGTGKAMKLKLHLNSEVY